MIRLSACCSSAWVHQPITRLGSERGSEQVAREAAAVHDDRGVPLDVGVQLLVGLQLGQGAEDLALASFAERSGMIDEAGEVVFAVARTAGWLAHAAEEYRHRLRFRSRAVYTGPRA